MLVYQRVTIEHGLAWFNYPEWWGLRNFTKKSYQEKHYIVTKYGLQGVLSGQLRTGVEEH